MTAVSLGLCLLLLLATAALPGPRARLAHLWRRALARRARTRAEDALKHILAWQHRSKLATPESLSGALQLSPKAVLRLATRMEAIGWIENVAGGIALTPLGERRALRLIRAHRLWERHLSDDANMPLARLHPAAERAEHSLSNEQLAALDAHLGHPLHDPHGDPIPDDEGHLTPLDAVTLNEWPVGTPGRIVHIEDEPAIIFRQILAADLKPARIVRVADSSPQGLLVESEGAKRRIDRAVAANIQVAAVRAEDLRPTEAVRLSRLAQGESGRIVELSPECRGFSRRRMLDLGLTPGALVEATLDNTFGDPRAFRVRGTTIALRQQQADHIWVRPAAANAGMEARP